MSKFFLAMTLGIMSFPTLAATNWVVQPYKNAAFSLAFDMNSLKTEEGGSSYGDETLEASVRTRLIFKTPQKLKSGSFFTHKFYDLHVNCEDKLYAQVDYVWNINGKFVAKNDEIPLSATWEEFRTIRHAYELSEAQAKQHKFTDIQANLLCQTVLQ